MWQKIKHDLYERFCNFETMRGVYEVPAGAVVIFVAVFNTAFLIKTMGALFGGYVICDGLRKIFVNRIKQQVARDVMAEKRKDPNVA